jgi:hypothetical protein
MMYKELNYENNIHEIKNIKENFFETRLGYVDQTNLELTVLLQLRLQACATTSS